MKNLFYVRHTSIRSSRYRGIILSKWLTADLSKIKSVSHSAPRRFVCTRNKRGMQSALVSASTPGKFSPCRVAANSSRAFLGTWNKITSASNFIAAFSYGRVIYRSLYFCRLVAANNSVWPTARRGAGRNSAPSRENASARTQSRIIRKRSQLPEVLTPWYRIYFSCGTETIYVKWNRVFFVRPFSSNLPFYTASSFHSLERNHVFYQRVDCLRGTSNRGFAA